MVEERFWHAAYRLRNTLDAGKLVVGGSDYYLAERLHREAGKLVHFGNIKDISSWNCQNILLGTGH